MRGGDEGQRNKLSFIIWTELSDAFFGAAFLTCLQLLIYFRQKSGLCGLQADHTKERSLLHRSIYCLQACITYRPIIETGLHYIQACSTGRPMLYNNKLLFFVLRIFREIHKNTQLDNLSTCRESKQRLIECRTDTTQPRNSFNLLLYIVQ